MAMTNSDRGRMAAGIAAGVAVGGGTTAATGWAITKAAAAVARTAGPRAAMFIPGIGWAVGGVALAASIYGGAKAAKATSDAGGNWKQIFTAGALGAAGVSPAAAQSVVQPAPVRRPGEAEIRRKQAEQRKKREGQGAKPQQAAQPAPAQPPAAPPPAIDAKPKSEYEQRREALERNRRLLEENLRKEQASGFGPRSKAAQEALDKNTQQLKELAAEQRNNDPFRIGMQIGLPAGALLVGGFAGNWFGKKAVTAAEAAGAKAAGQVEKLGKKAGELLKTSPKGVISGTVAGDKAKAVVNEAYKVGGAKSAFPSPGYPNPPAPGALFDKPMGLPGRVNYIIPAANMAIGGAEIGASFMTDDPTTRMVLRSAGAGEFAMGFFQYKALATAVGVKPAAGAVASIEGLRNRVTREAATGMPAGVAQVKAGRNLALARTGAGRDVSVAGVRAGRDVSKAQVAAAGAVKGERVRSGGRVAVTRHNTNTGVIRAGANAGVAKAQGAGRVARAESRNALGPDKYKNTWMDSRGRTYHRRDMSVRRAANSNTPPARTRKAN